ncbi:hypothetical protein QE152_g37509 [Popillia japonica]|uniref:Uncharacterized protein n=1 Tax=Popillia japonica TaxID=7064 RepID=A0AAW1I9N2_POPJA
MALLQCLTLKNGSVTSLFSCLCPNGTSHCDTSEFGWQRVPPEHRGLHGHRRRNNETRRREIDADLPPTSGSEGEPDGEEWTESKARKRGGLKEKSCVWRRVTRVSNHRKATSYQSVKPPKAGSQSKAQDEAANDGRHANSSKAGTSRSSPM